MRHADEQTVLAAREEYFVRNGFSEAHYQARWVVLRVLRIPVVFPNLPARRRAIPLHDLHHIATGYGTTLRGEAEIAAWELAAGCSRFYAAWVLNLLALGFGILAPVRTWRAWRRGRRSISLYRTGAHGALQGTVGDLRARLGIA